MTGKYSVDEAEIADGSYTNFSAFVFFLFCFKYFWKANFLDVYSSEITVNFSKVLNSVGLNANYVFDITTAQYYVTFFFLLNFGSLID